jgi:arylsulfatase A-like enzyme
VALVYSAGIVRAADAPRPNVVVILTDDQGWGDLSVHGNTNLSTPNIDTLARDGALFDRFFVCPVCSPTRAEFLTGRYHPRSGVYSTSSGGERMDLDERTIGDAFRAAGYATAAYGKWHNGAQWPYHPNARGFADYYGFCSGHWGDYFSPPLEHNGTIVRGNGFIIDDLTEHGMKFMEANTTKPFFLYLPFNTPHSPMQVPDKFYDKFAGVDLKLRSEPGEQPGKKAAAKKTKSYGGPNEDLEFTRAALAMCENIDWNVGRLLAKLDELKIDDNTIVLYFCDNGPNSARWNGKMKGRKGSTDEGGVRSPLLVRWPKHIPAGTKVMPIAGAIDLLPTLTDLCNVPVPAGKPLDGKSLKPLLLEGNGTWQDRVIVSHWNGNVSARSEQYRLDAAGKLYDLRADPGQKNDVTAEHPEIASNLSQAVAEYRRNVLAELPKDDARPFPVGYREFPQAHLPARDGIAHGGIQRSAGAPNCSFYTNWTSKDDSITWDIDVATAGRYEAIVYYTCKPENVGCTVELGFQKAKLAGKVTVPHDPPLMGKEHDRTDRGAESFVKDFKPWRMGEVDLPAGRGELALRALDIPGKGVIDVRLVTLKLLPE